MPNFRPAPSGPTNNRVRATQFDTYAMGRITAAGNLSRGGCIPEIAIHDLNG
jgi:hypothetical protein